MTLAGAEPDAANETAREPQSVRASAASTGTAELHLDLDPRFTEAAVEACYQCGKCSAGCPMADRMDLLPNQLVRLVQLGRVDQALRARSIWECVSCLTCSARCPQSVDCAGVMDVLRQLSVERALAAGSQRRTIIFQQVFLRNIRRYGRLNELDLVRAFKTRAFFDSLDVPFLFKDTMLAPRMLKRGKLHIKGERVKDRGIVDRIFERCGASTGESAGD